MDEDAVVGDGLGGVQDGVVVAARPELQRAGIQCVRTSRVEGEDPIPVDRERVAVGVVTVVTQPAERAAAEMHEGRVLRPVLAHRRHAPGEEESAGREVLRAQRFHGRVVEEDAAPEPGHGCGGTARALEQHVGPPLIESVLIASGCRRQKVGAAEISRPMRRGAGRDAIGVVEMDRTVAPGKVVVDEVGGDVPRPETLLPRIASEGVRQGRHLRGQSDDCVVANVAEAVHVAAAIGRPDVDLGDLSFGFADGRDEPAGDLLVATRAAAVESDRRPEGPRRLVAIAILRILEEEVGLRLDLLGTQRVEDEVDGEGMGPEAGAALEQRLLAHHVGVATVAGQLIEHPEAHPVGDLNVRPAVAGIRNPLVPVALEPLEVGLHRPGDAGLVLREVASAEQQPRTLLARQRAVGGNVQSPDLDRLRSGKAAQHQQKRCRGKHAFSAHADLLKTITFLG